MSDISQKISELGSATSIPENSVVPIVTNSLVTNNLTITSLRSVLNFEIAFNTIQEGLAATAKTDPFFVYTDGTQSEVAGYVNQGGGAFSTLLDKEGKDLYLPANNVFKALTSLVIGIRTFSDLRNTRPFFDGQRIHLNSYSGGNNDGEGFFIGHLSAKDDDGGCVASGAGFHWERLVEDNTVSPEMYGITGEEDDVSDKWSAMAGSGYDIHCRKPYTFKISKPIMLPYLDSYQTIDGGNSTFICSGNFSVWNWYNQDGTTNVICYRKHFRNMIGKGSISKNTAWANIGTSHFISFSSGTVENIRGSGFVNVLRAFGNTVARNIWGDDLRNALWSCYATPEDDNVGNNKIYDSELVWASGDGLIIKGPDVVVDNFRYQYAGCIAATNEDEIASLAGGGKGALRGVVLSVGADEKKARNVQITNVVGKYYGAGGFNIQGDNIRIGGLLSLGDIYMDNFTASLSTAGLFWAGATNWSCGDITAGRIFGGVGLNANCANFNLGLVTVESRQPVALGSLISIGDSATSSITNGYWTGIVCKGQSQINDDIYIATAGITIDRIQLFALNNQQGGYTMKVTKATRINSVYLSTTTSASTAPIVLLSGAANIGVMTINRVFGTALTVQGAIPKITNLYITNKQGTVAPIKIIGSATDNYIWGAVEISGVSTANPTLDGILLMGTYTGPDWLVSTAGGSKTVRYSQPRVNDVYSFSDLRTVKPLFEGERVTLKGYNSDSSLGGGEFVGHLGTKADDGGHIAAGSGFYWERVASTVNLYDYGIAPCTTSTLVDVTIPMQKAINRAKALHVPLVSDYDFPNLIYAGNFFYVTDTIDISGLTTMRGKYLFGVLSANFVGTWKTADNQRVVVKNMNGTYDANGKLQWSSTLGGQDIDTIYTRVWDASAPSDLQGIIFNTSYSRVGSLGAHRFNNAGVRIASSYDNTFDTIVTTRCGNADWYGLTHSSYPYSDKADESNANTINQLLVHDCYYRAWCVIGSKMNLVRVHEEGTVVPADFLTVRTTVKNEDSVNSKGYTSSYFYSTGGTLGELSVQGAGTASPMSPVFAGSVDTTTYNTVGVVYAETTFIDTFWKGNSGSIGIVKCENLTITNNATVSVGKIVATGDFFCDVPGVVINSAVIGGDVTKNSAIMHYAAITGNVTQDQYGKIFGGSCGGNFTMTNSSELRNFTITGTFNCSSPSPILNRCTITGAFNITGAGGGKFFDCTLSTAFVIKSTSVPSFYRTAIAGTVTIDSSVSGARALFNECSTTYNLSNGNGATVKIIGGSSGGITMTGFTGAVLIDANHICTAGNSIAGWAVPTITSVGFGARTINPYTGAGWVLLYNGSAAVWTATTA